MAIWVLHRAAKTHATPLYNSVTVYNGIEQNKNIKYMQLTHINPHIHRQHIHKRVSYCSSNRQFLLWFADQWSHVVLAWNKKCNLLIVVNLRFRGFTELNQSTRSCSSFTFILYKNYLYGESWQLIFAWKITCYWK